MVKSVVYKDIVVNQFTWEIIKFLESNLNRTYLRYKEGSFYVRKAKRNLCTSYSHNKGMYSTFDISVINIKDSYQNKGHFKAFLLTLSYCNTFDYIYVECVHNKILKDYFNRNGWITEDDESFYIETKLLQDTQINQVN